MVASTTVSSQISPSSPEQAPPSSLSSLRASFGVEIKSEPRLIAVMAALEAAGFDPTPEGRAPTSFLSSLRKEKIDEGLRQRLHSFYERHKLPAPATSADQAARFVSLAFALGPLPELETPTIEAIDELPTDVQDVLDFAPLVREFYRGSLASQMNAYQQRYIDEAKGLLQAAGEAIRATLAYLHTQPILGVTERVPVTAPEKQSKQRATGPSQTTKGQITKGKKNSVPRSTILERQRRFIIVPDLLAVPGTVNFRVVADDYFVVVPPTLNPNSAELRRAYLQFVIDPLAARNIREIANRRSAIKELLSERAKAGAQNLPDIFPAVTRSLVAAADTQMTADAKLQALTITTAILLRQVKNETTKEKIKSESDQTRGAINNEAIAQLADAYERGAVLSFYFADQLRGNQSGGFDIAGFFADLVTGFDLEREKKRPEEYDAPRKLALAARLVTHEEKMKSQAENAAALQSGGARSQLSKDLTEVKTLLSKKDYEAAETRLLELLHQFQGEPRIFFALGQASSIAAETSFDDQAQAERLNAALSNYRLVVQSASEETDPALVSNAHEQMGRILAFLGKPEEAIKEYEAAISLGPVTGGAYEKAIAGQKSLLQPAGRNQ